MGLPRTWIIICDIDNCYADSRVLDKYAPESKYDSWVEFHKHLPECTPCKPVIDFLLTASGILPIYFFTSREDMHGVRAVTEKQIKDFSDGRIVIGDTNKLYLRHEGDYTAADKLKENMLIDVVKQGFIPVMAIDDNEDNCKMFAKYNIYTLKYDIETIS